MKKITLVFLLASILVFGFTISAWADEVSTKVYFDTWVGGNTHQDIDGSDPTTGDFDTKSSFVGFETNVNRLKVAADFGVNGSIKASFGDLDYAIQNLKFGYRAIDGKHGKFDINAGIIKFDGEAMSWAFTNSLTGDDNVTGTMLGADLTYALSRQVFFQGSYEFSLDASCANWDTVDISSVNVKLGCLVSDDVAIAAGYRSYIIKASDISMGDETLKLDGLTLGVMFKF